MHLIEIKQGQQFVVGNHLYVFCVRKGQHHLPELDQTSDECWLYLVDITTSEVLNGSERRGQTLSEQWFADELGDAVTELSGYFGSAVPGFVATIPRK